jgi:alkylation response protein AidB-like acyl-CoA dehydrogenase
VSYLERDEAVTQADAVEDLDVFRARARAWITDNLEPLGDADPFMGHATDEADQVVRAKAIQRRLWDGGFAGLCYPAEYGGRSLPHAYQQAFNEESRGYELPLLFNTPTLTIITPTILDFGTEAQKRRYIPAVLKGEELWVQFLSEPTGGSDLAGALTRATRDGDVFVLNGSKIWSTYAWKSDYAVCVCRTDWDVPKHRGLSVLIVKVRQPGIRVDQIKYVDGTEEFCQEFFDDVLIPADQVLGAVNDGWNVVSSLLYHEREAMGGASPHEVGPRTSERRGSGRTGIAALAALVSGGADPRVRQLTGEARVLTRVHSALARRIAASIGSGRLPPPAGAISRLSCGLLGVRVASIAVEIGGSRTVAWEDTDPFGEIGIAYLGRQGPCLGGGSTEMARNIISERVLGMPRERADDLGRPFREVHTNAMPARG